MSQPETESKSKSIQLINWVLTKLESRAERVAEKADNHHLISKLTFILVLAMSYDLLGERVVTLVGLFL
jgi:hypothetical protein